MLLIDYAKIFGQYPVNDGWWKDISEMYELKPEYKQKQLEAEIATYERQIKSLTSVIAGYQEQLTKKKDELKAIKKE